MSEESTALLQEQPERASARDAVARRWLLELTRDRLMRQAWAQLRHQAVALLRAEVAAQARLLSSASPAEATAARQVLEALLDLPVLAGVRSPAALANLPEPERQMWQAFWQEVAGLLQGPGAAR